jgi:hypothetical protein
MSEHVSPIWEAQRGHHSKCCFCGKRGQSKFYSSTFRHHYACDCPEYLEYKELYDECHKKLDKLTRGPLLRKKIWDKEIEAEKYNDEIEKIADNLRWKEHYREYAEKDKEELQEDLASWEKIHHDEE